MNELPERKQEEFKELTEEEVKLLRKRERALEHDTFVYLIDAFLISTLLKSIYEGGRINPEDIFKVLNSIIYTHGYSKMSRVFEEDIGSYINKLMDKLPKALNPRPLLQNLILKFIDKDELMKNKKIPPTSYSMKNNHILLASGEYGVNEDLESPQKIIIYRARKKKIPAQKILNKRNLFNNKK